MPRKRDPDREPCRKLSSRQYKEIARIISSLPEPATRQDVAEVFAREFTAGWNGFQPWRFLNEIFGQPEQPEDTVLLFPGKDCWIIMSRPDATSPFREYGRYPDKASAEAVAMFLDCGYQQRDEGAR